MPQILGKDMKIAIFGNAMKAETLSEVTHLIEFMQLREVSILLSQELRQELNLREYPEFNLETAADGGIDFALSVGGDGTFLTTAAQVGDSNVPIIGINCGNLGFLAEVKTSDVDVIMDQLIQGKYTIEKRGLLQVTTSGNRLIPYPYALNEIAIMKQGLSSMITIETLVNGTPLTTYAADGLIVATPTGSTAYNMSVGGPLMVPQARGILLSPIASHSLNVRPLVIPDDWKLDMKISSRNGNYLISVDGRSLTITDDITLHIEKAQRTIKLVQVGEHSFIQSLKEKLSWGN